MTDRPEGLPLELWARLNDAEKITAVKTWPKLSEDDQAYAVAHPLDADVKDLVLEGGDIEEDAATDLATKSVGEQVQHIIEVLKADTAIVTEMAVAVKTALEVKYKKLMLMLHIERLGLAGVLPRYEAEPLPRKDNDNTLHDAYAIPRKSRRNPSKAIRPRVGHRLHDIYDKVWSGDVTALNGILALGKDHWEKHGGDDEKKVQKADARQPVKIGYEFWEDACSATHVMTDVNNRFKSVTIEFIKDKTGKVVDSQYPFKMIDWVVGTDGKQRQQNSTRLSISDLNKIDLDKAEKLVGEKDENGDARRVYDAILDSRKVKRETYTEKYNRLRVELVQVAGDIVKSGGQVPSTTVANVTQMRNVVYDLAQLAQSAKAKGEWNKLLVEDDNLLRAWYHVTLWTELLPKELRQKAAMLDDAELKASDDAEKDKAA